MGLNSINTNYGAMMALQNLNAINAQLATTQQRISTGLKVSSAKDNPAVWAIAQNQRGDIMALDSVKDSLQRGQSTIDVAISAGETISDLLNQMKAKALAAADVSLNADARSAMNDDFVALRKQIATTIANASFNGTNLLKTAATSLFALASADGSSHITVAAQVMGMGAGGAITFTQGANFTDAATASALVAALTTSITNVNASVARLGTGSKALDTHLTFIGKLQDTMVAGVGNLVDADVAKESAMLQALQVKQQLAIKAMAIANQASSYLLQLFR